MPLDAAGLSDDIEALAATPAADIAGCAGQWADAVQAFAASIVPASTTVAAASATLEGALATAFAASAAAPGMESAFAAFAVTVGTGMAPAFVATPPAGPVGFATQFLTQPATHALAASAISGLIDAWMKTGSAVPSGGGPSAPWT